jgi:hypothetical protein
MVTDGGLVDGVDRADVVVDPSLAPNPVTHRGVAPFPKSSPRRAFALSSRVSMSAVRRPSARPSVRSRARDRRRPFPSIAPARFARRRASPSRARDASREKRVARALFRGERFFARSSRDHRRPTARFDWLTTSRSRVSIRRRARSPRRDRARG